MLKFEGCSRPIAFLEHYMVRRRTDCLINLSSSIYRRQRNRLLLSVHSANKLKTTVLYQY